MTARATFVSYSWDSEAHKSWVKRLVERLRRDGAQVHFDQTDLKLGDRLPHFMERIAPSDFVLFICTPNYKAKADGRKGGIGYEGNIITAELVTSGNERKFIPVLASGTAADSLPTWAGGKFYVDLSKPGDFELGYQQILETIGQGLLHPTPAAVALRTSAPAGSATVQDQGTITAALSAAAAFPPIKILGIVLDEVTEPRLDGTPGSALYLVPFRLSSAPTDTWAQFFLAEWQFPKMFTTMHRPGTARIRGERLILDGVTMEEVRDVHKQTLGLCVDEANQKEAEYRRRLAAEQSAQGARSAAHRQNVRDVANQIKFD